MQVLTQRIHHARQAMQEAQASANSQEKSSAGDKYETSRAMGQLDRDMNAAQLLQAQQDYRVLENIQVNLLQAQAAPGAIIELETGLCFAALGLGQLTIDNKPVMAISVKSPLFELLKMKKSGDSILFNNRALKLLDVY